MTLNQLTERDCRVWELSAIKPHDRLTWRSGVRSSMSAASQVPGRVVKMVDRHVNVLLNTIYIFQDISSISALVPCAREFVSPAIPCYSGERFRASWPSCLYFHISTTTGQKHLFEIESHHSISFYSVATYPRVRRLSHKTLK